MKSKRLLIAAFVAGLILVAAAGHPAAAEWNQWRGSQRDGIDHNSPPLISDLPQGGLPATWIVHDNILQGGGWSSPIVADGKAFVYKHVRERREGVELPEEKFPPLTDEQKRQLSSDEQAKYEEQRNAEQRQRRNLQFRAADAIYAIDVASGELVWKHDRASGHTRWRQSTTPAVIGQRLYYNGADGQLCAVDAKNGELVWATTLPQQSAEEKPFTSSVAVADGVVVTLAGQLTGVRESDGKLLWTGNEEGHAYYASPTVWQSGDREYVIANLADQHTVCVDPQTGRELWRIETHAGRSTPVVQGDLLITYGSSRKGGVRAYDITPSAATERWVYQGVADAGSSPVIYQGHVYAQGDRRLVCLDVQSGKAQWQSRLSIEDARYTSLVAADGKLIFACEGVLAFAANPQQFQPLIDAKVDKEGRLLPTAVLQNATARAEDASQALREAIGPNQFERCSSPALADGRLYVRLKSGLACFDLRAGAE